MIAKKNVILSCIAGLLLAGCGGGAQDEAAAAAPAVMPKGGESATPSTTIVMDGAMNDSLAGSQMKLAAQEGVAAPKQEKTPRKIIFTGDVLVDCENLERAGAKLEEIVKSFGGYVGNASLNMENDATRQSTWTVRVPSARFSACIKAAEGLGELRKSERKGEDVSEEFYDAQARLKNKRVEENRLVDLLKTATGKLGEILTVEKEISRVREEIEVIEGRLRFLSNQSDLSTIVITAREVKNFVPATAPTLPTKVARSFNTSVTSLQDVATSVLLAIVAFVPWIIPIGILFWVCWRTLGRRMRMALLPPPAAPPVA